MARENPTEDFAKQIAGNLGLGDDDFSSDTGGEGDLAGDLDPTGDDYVQDTHTDDPLAGIMDDPKGEALGLGTPDPSPDPQGDLSADPAADPLEGLFTGDGSTEARPQQYAIDKKTGDVVHAQTGQVLAKAGQERRFYQGMHKAQDQAALTRQENTTLRDKVVRAVNIGRELHQRMKMQREEGSVGTRLGLSEQETVNALNLAAELKANPQQGLKNLLTQLSINGIDISGLGVDSGGGLDAKALGGMIRTELQAAVKPLHEVTERQRQQEQTQNANNQQYQQIEAATKQFFNSNPAAVPHLETLLRMTNSPSFQNNSLRENWLQLQLHLARNPVAGESFPRDQRSLPSGRPGFAPTTQGQTNTRSSVAPIDQDYKSIVNDILDEAGMKLEPTL